MIIFIFGEDDFRGKKKIGELKEKFLKDVDPSGNSLVSLRGKEASMKDIGEKCGASSLLSPKRMVVLEDIFSNSSILKEVVEYFQTREEKGSDNIFVFWEPRIKTKKKKGEKVPLFLDDSGRERPLTQKARELFDFLNSRQYVQEFPSLSHVELAGWAKQEAEKRGAVIDRKAVQLLIGMTAGDLWRMDRELDKLIHYKKGEAASGQQAEIEAKDVETMTVGLFHQDIFALTDAVGSKDFSAAAELLEKQLLAGANEHFLLSMMIRQVKILLQVRQALDSGWNSGKIASQLKLHPFVVQKAINQARKFDLTRLKKALNRLVEMDSELKTGRGEAKTMLDLFLFKISS